MRIENKNGKPVLVFDDDKEMFSIQKSIINVNSQLLYDSPNNFGVREVNNLLYIAEIISEHAAHLLDNQ